MSLTTLLGLMVADMEALQWGRLHTRELQWFLSPYQCQITAKIDQKLQLTSRLRDCLCWWTKPSHLSGRKHLPGVAEEHIMTNASLLGWGTIWGRWTVRGKWSLTETNLPINLLELQAICLALQHFGILLRGRHVLIRMDNVAAKAYLNKQGGTRSSQLHKEALLLFAWAEEYLEGLRAEHVRGLDNVQADWLSRETVSPGEWALHPDSFARITDRFVVPIVDLFASHQNRQVPRFFSRYYHPEAEGLDVLTEKWPKGLLYAFPPIPLFPRVLRNIRQQKATVILVAPWWLHRPWFSMIQYLSQEPPLQLSPFLLMLYQGPILYRAPHKLRLTGWKLNGNI